MTETITGGAFLISRLLYESAIWRKKPLLLKLFMWLIGKASYGDGCKYKGHILRRGELVTTYNEIAEALAYTLNRAIKKPTLKEVRIMLEWLRSEGMITVKPLIDGTLPNKGRPNDLTRAYVGLLIAVVKYDTYQDIESYKGRDKGRPSDEQGQLDKERINKNKKTFSSDSIEIRLAEFLLEKILLRLPGFKKPNLLQLWAKDIDLMIRIDSRTPESIRQVIQWCQDDPFWQGNILSTAKLRKQFDQLQVKMQGINTKGGSSGIVSSPVAPAASECPRCGRRIVVKADLTEDGCVYCEART